MVSEGANHYSAGNLEDAERCFAFAGESKTAKPEVMPRPRTPMPPRCTPKMLLPPCLSQVLGIALSNLAAVLADKGNSLASLEAYRRANMANPSDSETAMMFGRVNFPATCPLFGAISPSITVSLFLSLPFSLSLSHSLSLSRTIQQVSYWRK